jgi:hypothetical protein
MAAHSVGHRQEYPPVVEAALIRDAISVKVLVLGANLAPVRSGGNADA